MGTFWGSSVNSSNTAIFFKKIIQIIINTYNSPINKQKIQQSSSNMYSNPNSDAIWIEVPMLDLFYLIGNVCNVAINCYFFKFIFQCTLCKGFAFNQILGIFVTVGWGYMQCCNELFTTSLYKFFQKIYVPISAASAAELFHLNANACNVARKLA